MSGEVGRKKRAGGRQIRNRAFRADAGYEIRQQPAIFLLLFLLMVCCPPLSSAEIYQWTDSDGNVVFSDSPPAGIAAREVKPKSNNRTEMAYPRREPQKAGIGKTEPQLRDAADIGVILYVTSWCPYCKKAKEYLSSKGLRFAEYDIERDRKKEEEMKAKTGSRSVPVIDIEGTIIRGFAPSAIDAAVLAKRRVRD